MRRPTCLAAIAVCIGLAGSARADGVAPSAATPAQHDQAQARFLRGRDLFNQGQYPAALEAFRGSLEIVASPNARLYIARCHKEIGDVGLAHQEYTQTIADARGDPHYQRAAESAEEERKALGAKVGFVAITMKGPAQGTTLRVSGREIPRARWSEPVPVTSGHAEVVVETPSRPPQTLAVDVTAGQTRSVSFDVEGNAQTAAPAAVAPAPAPTPPAAADGESGKKTLRIASYAAAGVAGLGIASFVVFGAMSSSKYSDLKSACNGGPCPPSRQSDIDAGKRDQRIANVALVLGLVSAGAAVTLFVLSQPKKTQPPSAALVVGPSELAVRGAF
jgi:hypothetical protein